MNAPKFWMVVPALLVAGAVGLAYAKLPQPPMDDAAKAKAVEAKAKAADAAKMARAQEEKAMDRAVERYKKGKGIKTAAAAAPATKKK
jgi:hypothetical protein